MEQVNHPSHYQKHGRKECIEEMKELYGDIPVFFFCILNSYKYNYRAGQKTKDPSQDQSKAYWYEAYAANILRKLPFYKQWLIRFVSKLDFLS